MDVLLTPAVNRFLRRFIKKAAGEETSQLRVSLSRGSVALHNLELNLDGLAGRLPVSVKRAFARSLTISVPWTSFKSQPLQVDMHLSSQLSTPDLKQRVKLVTIVFCSYCKKVAKPVHGCIIVV